MIKGYYRISRCIRHRNLLKGIILTLPKQRTCMNTWVKLVCFLQYHFVFQWVHIDPLGLNKMLSGWIKYWNSYGANLLVFINESLYNRTKIAGTCRLVARSRTSKRMGVMVTSDESFVYDNICSKHPDHLDEQMIWLWLKRSGSFHERKYSWIWF